MLLVPQAHRRGLIGLLLQEQELSTSQLPQAMDFVRLFSMKLLGEAQRGSKVVAGDAHVFCGMSTCIEETCSTSVPKQGSVKEGISA